LFLEEFHKVEPMDWKSKIILDPCAGGDEKQPMSYPETIKKVHGNCNIHTIDIRADSRASIIADYLSYNINFSPDIIISNPPFSKALEFIQKGLNDVCEGGFVMMLLRLNFLESRKRKAFFEKHMPKYVFVHHSRMSFTADGVTDSCAYCHMVWQKGYKNNSFAGYII
jgi:hypothetical protein